jgi:hypothetical protein
MRFRKLSKALSATEAQEKSAIEEKGLGEWFSNIVIFWP